MNRSVFSTLFGICMGCFSVSLIADQQEEQDPDIVLITGAKGGGYWSAGERFQAVAEEMEIVLEHRFSTGSLDNLKQLTDAESPVNMAFVQADALRYFLNGNPDQERRLEIVENIGLECVFMVTKADSDLRNEKDLQEASDLRVGIPSATSGVAVTFDYMASQLPELQDIEVVYADGGPVIEKLNASGGKVDVVMTVHRPKEHSAELDAALNSPDKYRLITLNDSRLTGDLPDGSKVYRSMNLALPGSDKSVQTICVQGLLLLNKEKMTGAQRSKLDSLVDYHWIKIYATP